MQFSSGKYEKLTGEPGSTYLKMLGLPEYRPLSNPANRILAEFRKTWQDEPDRFEVAELLADELARSTSWTFRYYKLSGLALQPEEMRHASEVLRRYAQLSGQ